MSNPLTIVIIGREGIVGKKWIEHAVAELVSVDQSQQQVKSLTVNPSL